MSVLIGDSWLGVLGAELWRWKSDAQLLLFRALYSLLPSMFCLKKRVNELWNASRCTKGHNRHDRILSLLPVPATSSASSQSKRCYMCSIKTESCYPCSCNQRSIFIALLVASLFIEHHSTMRYLFSYFIGCLWNKRIFQHLPKDIFSPESAGKRNTSSAKPDMRTQGMSKFKP